MRRPCVPFCFWYGTCLLEELRMNRALLFGIAIFFAVVGIALIGGESKVLAGHGCCGCSCGGCGGGHHGCCGCGGRRHHRRSHGCCGCCGYQECCNTCCGQQACCQQSCAPACAPACPPACCGNGQAAPVAAPANGVDEAPATPTPDAAAPQARLERGRARLVSFRR